MAKKNELLKRIAVVAKATKQLEPYRWILAFAAGLESQGVYGPYATQREFVDGLVEACKANSGEDDTFHILSFDHGSPEITDFSGGFMELVRRLAFNGKEFMTKEELAELYEE